MVSQRPPQIGASPVVCSMATTLEQRMKRDCNSYGGTHIWIEVRRYAASRLSKSSDKRSNASISRDPRPVRSPNARLQYVITRMPGFRLTPTRSAEDASVFAPRIRMLSYKPRRVIFAASDDRSACRTVTSFEVSAQRQNQRSVASS